MKLSVPKAPPSVSLWRPMGASPVSALMKIVEESQKEAYARYQKHLALLHHMSVYSMKCKQTTDLAFVEKLRATITDFEHAYFHKH